VLPSAHALAKKSAIPADKLALYEALIKSVPQIERKGAVHPYTSLNGHMFTYLDQTGTLGLRLPPDALATFITDLLVRSKPWSKSEWLVWCRLRTSKHFPIHAMIPSET
jgi:hypothetical protein